MKYKPVFALVFLVMLSFSWNAFAHGTTYYFDAKPGNPQNYNEYFSVLPANNTEPLIFADHGKAFPAGSKARIVEDEIQNQTMFWVEYKLPGDNNWHPVTEDMIYCVDDTGKPCPVPTQPAPTQTPLPQVLPIQPDPPKEEEFQCVGWGLIGAGIAGVPTLFLPPIKFESSTSNTSTSTEIPSWATAIVAGLGGAAIDCSIQYAAWRRDHPKTQKK